MNSTKFKILRFVIFNFILVNIVFGVEFLSNFILIIAATPSNYENKHHISLNPILLLFPFIYILISLRYFVIKKYIRSIVIFILSLYLFLLPICWLYNFNLKEGFFNYYINN